MEYNNYSFHRMKRATTQELAYKDLMKSYDLTEDDIARFKRYVHSKSPGTVQKRKNYAKEEKVKERRSELNKERRYLCSILIKMLKEGDLKNAKGETLNFYNNRCIQQETKEVYLLDAKKNVIKKKYVDEITLMDQEYNPPLPLREKPGIQILLKKFVKNDPIITDLVARKRVVAEEINQDVEEIRRLIKSELSSEEYESE